MVHRTRFAHHCPLLVAAALCGCHHAPETPATPSNPPPVSPQTRQVTTPPPAPPTPAPIQEAVNALLAQSGSSPFPKGARVLSVDLKDGVATLDFSKEFNKLANSGDTTESMAMKALQATLAKFPEVQKMRATVEGKPFDSQVTDWNTPFAVRNTSTGSEGTAQGGGQ